MDWLDYVLSQSDPPLTISTSYGDDEQTGPILISYGDSLFTSAFLVPQSYAVRACSGFAQLGVFSFHDPQSCSDDVFKVPVA